MHRCNDFCSPLLTLTVTFIESWLNWNPILNPEVMLIPTQCARMRPAAPLTADKSITQERLACTGQAMVTVSDGRCDIVLFWWCKWMRWTSISVSKESSSPHQVLWDNDEDTEGEIISTGCKILKFSSNLALEDGCTLKSITPLLEVTPPLKGSSVECSRLHPNHHYLESNGVGLMGAKSAPPLPFPHRKTRHRINISF